MIEMKLPLSSPRVDLSLAMKAVLQVLRDAPSMSIAGIAQATGIDRRTVSKALDMILSIQENLTNRRVEKQKVGRMWVISLKTKTTQLIESAKGKMKK
jgi:DNA-binding MarR family transcriptional regulator